MENFCSSKEKKKTTIKTLKKEKKAKSDWEKMLLQKPTKNLHPECVKDTV